MKVEIRRFGPAALPCLILIAETNVESLLIDEVIGSRIIEARSSRATSGR